MTCYDCTPSRKVLVLDIQCLQYYGGWMKATVLPNRAEAKQVIGINRGNLPLHNKWPNVAFFARVPLYTGSITFSKLNLKRVRHGKSFKNCCRYTIKTLRCTYTYFQQPPIMAQAILTGDTSWKSWSLLLIANLHIFIGPLLWRIISLVNSNVHKAEMDGKMLALSEVLKLYQSKS